MSKLNGVWRFTIVSMMGEQYSTDTFNVDGDVLTGSVLDEATNESSPIEEGKVDGDNFSFKVTMKLPFGIMPFEISGTLLADGTLKGESVMPMGTSNFTAVKIG